jgi:hypothetical protein
MDTLQEPPLRFYSKRAISIATFFGGPLAAGVLVRQNYLNEGKTDQATHALFIGIVSTILLFAAIFLIPEDIMDNTPSAVIPGIYTAIILVLVETVQGKTLKAHAESNGQFYSGWKAAGVGAVCMVIMTAGIFAIAMLAPDDFDTVAYDNGIAAFGQNEQQAMQLYDLLENEEIASAIDFIYEEGIPAWQRNIHILDGLDTLSGLIPELKQQNQLLREYTELRISSYGLIRQALTEQTDTYDLKIDAMVRRIDEILKEV